MGFSVTVMFVMPTLLSSSPLLSLTALLAAPTFAGMATRSSKWNISDIPDQTGRTAVVTGANSGLGIATVEALAGAGAHVVLAVRDPARGSAAAARVNGSVEVRRLDLADLAS